MLCILNPRKSRKLVVNSTRDVQANIKQDRGPGALARSSDNFAICFRIWHLWLDQEYSDGYGAAKKASPRLTAQVDAVLGVLNTLAFDGPGDETYASIRTQLELADTPIGGNDLLIAAHAVALDLTLVTDNDKEFSRVSGLRVENWMRA